MVPEGFDSQTETDGTGPYTLDAWTKGSTLALKAATATGATPPKNGAVTFHYYTDATAMTTPLSAGALTSSRPCSPRMRWPPSRATPTFVVSEGTSTTKELLAFNDAQAPFQ